MLPRGTPDGTGRHSEDACIAKGNKIRSVWKVIAEQ